MEVQYLAGGVRLDFTDFFSRLPEFNPSLSPKPKNDSFALTMLSRMFGSDLTRLQENIRISDTDFILFVGPLTLQNTMSD